MEKTRKSGFGTAGLVLGIIAICFSFIPVISYFSFILGILAIVFSVVSLCKKASKGLAVAGLILSIIAVIMAYSMHQGIKNVAKEVSGALNELSNITIEENIQDEKATLEKFNKISTGMTYQEVVDIMGEEGTLSTESSYGSQTMQVYSWSASNGISNATVSFMNGKVSGKSQIGLK